MAAEILVFDFEFFIGVTSIRFQVETSGAARHEAIY